MPKNSFLFVPYHAGSQNTTEQRLATSDARSHAAAVSRQRRDNRTRLENEGGNSVALTAQSDTSGVNSDHDGSYIDSASPISGGEESHFGRGQRRRNMRAMQFSWRTGNTASDLRAAAALSSGPFEDSIRSSSAQEVFQYYTGVLQPVNHPIYTIFNVTPVFTDWFMELMNDKDYFPAGLAMVRVLINRTRGLPQTSNHVSGNRNEAVRRLALRRERGVDDTAIIISLALGNVARLLGDIEIFAYHRKDVQEMVLRRGGLDNLTDQRTKCLLMQWNDFWLIDKQGSMFPDNLHTSNVLYPVYPLSVEVRETIINLPFGFQTLIMKGKLSTNLIRVLARFELAMAQGVQALTTSDVGYAHNDFVEACPSLARCNGSDATISIEQQVCMTLLIYCANMFTALRSNTASYIAARLGLTNSFFKEDGEEFVSKPERECSFWMCTICVDSWREHGPGSPLLSTGVDLLGILQRKAQDLDVENVLQKFFSSQELLENCTRYLGIRHDVDM